MRLLSVLCAAALLTACNSPSEPDDRWARPEDIAFASVLEVDLEQMTRTATGLYYQDLVVGTGAMAIARTSMPFMEVGVHYNAWLPDGTLIDTSYDSENVPVPVPLGAGLVIRGWDEGIAGMQVGGRRRLVIRPELAYGRTGKGPVPPLATLVFEVHLMWVK
jgi:FKBP-type peptidyl-prolyl cis-trans isomerase FkpA